MNVKPLLNAAIIALLVAAAMPSAPARGAGVPPGSYRGSCSDVQVNGATLEATCRNARGRPVRASLADYDVCRGNIQNNDGRLECVELPSGSYRQTCKEIVVDGSLLKAVCADANGHDVGASLQGFNRCRAVTNENGRLVCTGSSSRIPDGSFRATCRDIAVGGGTLYATCQTARGAWVPSALSEYPRCANEIRNTDGRLEC